MSKLLDKVKAVNESITVNKYDNGWMVEISGRDSKEDWKTIKVICNTEDELLTVIKTWNTKELTS